MLDSSVKGYRDIEKELNPYVRIRCISILDPKIHHQGIRIKVREMALVWNEKACRTALLFRRVRYYTRTLFWYKHKHLTFPLPCFMQQN